MSVRSLLGALTAILLAALPIQAASDYLLVLDGIPGESTDARYPAAIEIESFSFGVSQSGTIIGGGGGAGKATFSDMAIMKRLDKSSPLLYLNCAQGKHLDTATVILRKAGEKPFEYLVVKMTDVLISSVQTSGSAGSDTPTESLSLNFAKIEISYMRQKPDGGTETTKTGWDMTTNTPYP
jgi:type VI secretion system secreted protein Hcp